MRNIIQTGMVALFMVMGSGAWTQSIPTPIPPASPKLEFKISSFQDSPVLPTFSLQHKGLFEQINAFIQAKRRIETSA